MNLAKGAPVTLITGTSRGIGRHLVGHYVERGHHVIGCSRREVDWCLEGYRHYVTDVADETVVKRMFAEIRREYSRLDNLINNAGIASMNHCLTTPLSTVHALLNTNFVGTFLFCREAAKQMKKHGRGRIINFSTVAVPLRLEGEAIYAASKAAVESLTKIIARELAPYGITVNAVGPTPVDTDLIRSVPDEKIDAILQRQALPRLGTVEDVSNIIDFFLREESGMVTGQVVYLGGV